MGTNPPEFCIFIFNLFFVEDTASFVFIAENAR